MEGCDAERNDAEVVQTLVGDVVGGKQADRGSHRGPGAEETAGEGRHCCQLIASRAASLLGSSFSDQGK